MASTSSCPHRRRLLLSALFALLALVADAAAQTAVSGPRRAVVLFARFADEPDADSLAPPWSAGIFDPDRRGSLAHFYDDMSFGALELRGQVARRRYAVSHPADWYAPSGAPTSGRYRDFALDVLRQADADLDFARFDADGDGQVDALFIVLSTTPRNFINAGATGVGNLGLDTTFVTGDIGRDGRPVLINPAKGTLQRGRFLAEAVGSMAHEYGHVLGLSDLYNVAYAQSNTALPPSADDAGIGAWGLMGWGADGWPGGQGGPAALSAWSRLQLGWARVRTPGAADSTVRLEPVATTGQLMKLPVTGREFFLLEYRTRDGFYDRDIPAEGLLVWHVTRFDKDEGGVSRTRVDLETADGRWQDAGFPLGRIAAPESGEDNLDFWARDGAYLQAHNGNLGDATDPFDGVRYTAFTPETNPASTSLDGSLSVRLEDIRIDGGAVTARVTLPPPFLEFTRLVLLEEDRDGLFFADERVTVLMGLRNQGGVELVDVRSRLVSDDPRVTWEQRESGWGNLRLGETVIVPDESLFPSFRVHGGFTGIYHTEVAMQLWSGDEFLLERPIPITLYSPRLGAASAALVDTSGNADGVAQPGELVSLDLRFAAAAAALDAQEVANWRTALGVVDLSVRALDGGVTALEDGGLRLSLEAAGPRVARSPRYLLAPELGRDGLAVAGRLRFELSLRSAFDTWRDTVHVPFAAGVDRTGPRVQALRTVSDADGITLTLDASRIIEAGSVSMVRATVHRLADTVRVAAVDLRRQADGTFRGLWPSPPEGTYLVRAEVTDDAGNTGRAPLQLLSTPGAPLAPVAGARAWTPLPALPRLVAPNPLAPTEPTAPTGAQTLAFDAEGRLHAGTVRLDEAEALAAPALAVRDAEGWSWIESATPPHVAAAGAILSGLVVDPLRPDRLLAQLGGRILSSDNAGFTWRAHVLLSRSRSVEPLSLVADPARPGTYYAGADGFFVSRDYGSTWERLMSTWRRVDGVFSRPILRHLAVRPTATPTIFATVGASLWRSTDGGANWDEAYAALDFEPKVFARPPDTAFRLVAADDDGFYRSDDEGRSWSRLADFGPGAAAPVRLRFHPHDADHFYLVVEAAGAGAVLESRDAGLTWAALPTGTATPLHVTDVAVDPVHGHLYAATPSGIYRLDESVFTAVAEAPAVPERFALDANYPNPFNADTVIPFRLARSGSVELAIYNVAGQRVRTLLDETRPAGAYRSRWDARDDAGRSLASGIYLYVLRGPDGQRLTRRLLLLK